jgi:hypothetical protein
MFSRNKWKALLLIPAAAAGAFTALCISYSPTSKEELGFMLLFLTPFYLGNLGALAWMWRKPPGGRHLGLTRGSWTGLVAVAYLLGLGLLFAS